MSVRDRYLVDRLAPRMPGHVSAGTEVGPSAAVVEDDSAHELEASLHESKDEFNRAVPLHDRFQVVGGTPDEGAWR